MSQATPSSQPPKVSVVLTTYNSSAWVKRSLESILAQETPFPFEIVVGDDLSPDNTLEIVRGYQRQYPEIIKIVDRSAKVGVQQNYYSCFELCQGEYIGWLDADDCWTDPHKLAIQAEALDNNPDVSVCCHYVRRVTAQGEIIRDRFPGLAPGRHGMDAILHENFVPSPSIMFRRPLYRQLPQWYFDLGNLSDWPVLIVGALSGPILLLDRNMAAYTMNPESSFEAQGLAFREKVAAQFLERVSGFVPAPWNRVARKSAGKHFETLAYLLRKQGQYTASRQAAWKAFSLPAWNENLARKSKALLAAVIREAQHGKDPAPAAGS